MVRLKVIEPPPAPRPPRVALISLTTFCNAHCAFCCVLDILNRPELSPSDERVREAMARSREEGCTTLSFTGGEPTVHPRFAEFCREGRAMGYEAITINTNGIKFKSRAWTEEALAAGLTHIDFSVHGHTAALHDALVERPGAFDAIVKGAGHLAALAPKYTPVLGATTVVTASNAPHLAATADKLIDLGFRALRFKHCFEGAPGADAALVGLYADAVGPLRQAVARAHARGAGVQVTHFPLCLLGEEAVFATDLLEENVLSIDHKDAVLLDGRASLHRRADASPCERCLLAGPCTKLDTRYAAAHAGAELRPVEDPTALRTFLARGLDRYDAHHHPVREAVDRLLALHGAEALPPATPRHGSHDGHDGFHPQSQSQSHAHPGPVDTLAVHLGGMCTLACPGCDCRETPTAVDSEGVPEGVRGGGRRLVLRGDALAASALDATIRAAAEAGWREVWVRSTGGAMVDPTAAEALRARGVHGVLVPLSAHQAAVHDRVAGRPGALVDALRVLRTAAGAGLAAAIEVPLLPPRIQDLEAVVSLALRAVPTLRWARFYVPTREQPAAVAPPRWSEGRPALERALAHCRTHGVEASAGPAEGIPPCALGLREIPDGTVTAVGSGRSRGRPPGFVDPPVCGPCALWGRCPGPTRAYHAAHGGQDLVPVLATPAGSPYVSAEVPGRDHA